MFIWSSTLYRKYNCGICQPKTTCEEIEAEPAVEYDATGCFCWIPSKHFLCLLDIEWSQQRSLRIKLVAREYDKLLLFVENFDISGIHGWFLFRRRDFMFASDLDQVSIDSIIYRLELSVLKFIFSLFNFLISRPARIALIELQL